MLGNDLSRTKRHTTAACIATCHSSAECDESGGTAQCWCPTGTQGDFYADGMGCCPMDSCHQSAQCEMLGGQVCPILKTLFLKSHIIIFQWYSTLLRILTLLESNMIEFLSIAQSNEYYTNIIRGIKATKNFIGKTHLAWLYSKTQPYLSKVEKSPPYSK